MIPYGNCHYPGILGQCQGQGRVEAGRIAAPLLTSRGLSQRRGGAWLKSECAARSRAGQRPWPLASALGPWSWSWPWPLAALTHDNECIFLHTSIYIYIYICMYTYIGTYLWIETTFASQEINLFGKRFVPGGGCVCKKGYCATKETMLAESISLCIS